jgi:hypothetical protein
MNSGLMLKSVAGMLAWWALTVLVGFANFIVALQNFLAVSYSLYLQNVDSEPLVRQRFIGGFFRAFGFMAEATFADLSGIAIAASALCLFFLVFNALANAWEARQGITLNDDAEQQRAFRSILREKLLEATVLLIVLTPIVVYDVKLTQFRSAAASLNTDNPQEMVTVEEYAKLRGDMPTFGMEIGAFSPYALIAMTCGLSLCLELCGKKGRQYFDRSIRLLADQAQAEEPAAEELLGYDAAGQAVFAPNTDPAIELAYDAQGNGIGAAATAVAAEPVTAEAGTEQHAEPQAGERTPLFVVPNLGRAAESEPKPHLQRAVEAEAAEPARQANAAAEYTVVGTGERVTWAEAVQDKEKYYTDIKTHTVYDRSTYEALHGGEPQVA